MRGDLTLGLGAAIWYREHMMLRRLIISLLAAVLALSSVMLAIAQHGTAGGTTLILCTSAGEQMVTLDADGNPVPAAHPCPDCVAGIAAQDVPPAAQMPLPPLAQGGQLPVVATHLAQGRAIPAAQARGPPLVDLI